MKPVAAISELRLPLEAEFVIAQDTPDQPFEPREAGLDADSAGDEASGGAALALRAGRKGLEDEDEGGDDEFELEEGGDDEDDAVSEDEDDLDEDFDDDDEDDDADDDVDDDDFDDE